MARKKLYDENGNEVNVKIKKPFYKKWWFWLLGFIVVGVALSGGGDNTEIIDNPEVAAEESIAPSESSAIVSQEETVTEEEAAKTYSIGDTVEVGDVMYVVNSVDVATNVGGEYGQNSKGTYLIIDLTVTNNGNEALTVTDSFFKLINDGKEYESDTSAGIYANEEGSFFLESINPELSMNGKVVFDVSDNVLNSSTKQLQVSTGFWGTETELINLK